MLAAGNSRRFGANKLLYEIDGIPMYRHVLEQLDDTKKKIENIYSEYSDITEDNNNDNNSDIVQLNNLYRNNITAKIIGVVPIIKIFKGLIHLGAFISYILSFFLAIRNIKRYAAYKRKIGKNTIRVEVKYITYMTKEEAERKKREREQREREEQIASWIREKEMSSLKTQTEDNWRWKTEMESARLQEEMRKEREYQSELDRLNMLRRTNQMGETDYNYWMGNLESKHRR